MPYIYNRPNIPWRMNNRVKNSTGQYFVAFSHSVVHSSKNFAKFTNIVEKTTQSHDFQLNFYQGSYRRKRRIGFQLHLNQLKLFLKFNFLSNYNVIQETQAGFFLIKKLYLWSNNGESANIAEIAQYRRNVLNKNFRRYWAAQFEPTPSILLKIKKILSK